MFCAKVSFWARPQVQSSGRGAALRAETSLKLIGQETVRQSKCKITVEKLCSEQVQSNGREAVLRVKKTSTIISQKTVRQAMVEELCSEQRQSLKQWSRSCAPNRNNPQQSLAEKLFAKQGIIQITQRTHGLNKSPANLSTFPPGPP